ncbi:DUF2442 domain-containing protein [Caballeronia sp. 15715]|uniref:DUF2442 domain-containing protein n=1 Tax=unclassified Caballeronia TaxID=2646786 RepID=UPI0039E6A253
MAITIESMAAARKRGEGVGPCAVKARYRRSIAKIEVEFDNGVTLAVPIALIQGLDGASDAELKMIEISPAGWGLHFPKLDVDLYALALFEGIYGSQVWMKHLASRAGSVKSDAKAASSRENGKKGGRPRKVRPDHEQP